MIDKTKLLALRDEYTQAIFHYQGAVGAINRLLDEEYPENAISVAELGQAIGVQTIEQPQPLKES